MRDAFYRLENEYLILDLDRSGSVTSLFSKVLQKEFLEERINSPLFRLMIPNSLWDGRHIDSCEQERVEFLLIDSRSARIVYRNLEVERHGFDLNVVVHMVLDREDIRLSIEVENSSDELVSDVIFPIVSGFGRNTEEYSLYMPTQFRDRIVKHPLKNLGDDNHITWNRMRHKLYLRYPQWLVSSWVDFSNEKNGLAIDVRNGDFELFDFYVEKLILKDKRDASMNRRTLQMAIAFYPNLRKGERWKSCEIILTPHTGDWHITADRHRKWLDLIIQRPEVCESFKNSVGWTFYFMKHQDGTQVRNYSDIDRIARETLRTGLKYAMVFGWQEKGHDNYYSFGYYPNRDWGGLEALKKGISRARKSGCELIPFFNGTLLDTKTAEYKEFGYRWPVLGRTGSPYSGGDASRNIFDIPFRNAAMATSSRNMMLYDLCITGKESSKWFLDTAKRIMTEYDFQNIQLDQIGHKSYVCHNGDHGHTRSENAYTKELADLLSKLRVYMKSHCNPNAVIISEGFSDLVSRYCDGSWNWFQLENPEIVRYSLPWIIYSHEIDALEYANANRCFANGILFDLKINGGDNSIEEFPEFQQHILRLARLKPRLKNTYVDGDFRDEENVVYSRDTSVVVKRYAGSSGETSLLVANCRNARRIFDFECDSPDKNNAIVHYLDGRDILEKIDGGNRIELDPYEVRAYEYNSNRDS